MRLLQPPQALPPRDPSLPNEANPASGINAMGLVQIKKKNLALVSPSNDLSSPKMPTLPWRPGGEAWADFFLDGAALEDAMAWDIVPLASVLSN